MDLPKGWHVKPREIRLDPSATAEAILDVSPPEGIANQYVDAVVRLNELPSKGGADKSLAYIPGKGGESEATPELVRERIRIHAVPGVVVGRAGTSPKIDGKLDDACWRGAASVTDLVSYMSTGRPAEDDTLTGPKPALAKTEVYLTYDDTALYMGFRCDREIMDTLRATFKPGSASPTNLWHDDHVECYLDPGRKLREMVQLMVTPLAAVRNRGGAQWRYASAIGKKGWSVEMAFPFTNVSGPPRPGDQWGANFVRFDHAGTKENKDQRSEWSCTFSGGRAAWKFGVLVFAPTRN